MKELIDSVIVIVCLECGVTPGQAKGRFKDRKITETRFIIYHFLHLGLGLTYKETGEILNRDHSSVLSGINRLDYLLSGNDPIKLKYKTVANKLESFFNKKMIL